MAILLPYSGGNITPEQRKLISKLLGRFEGEISQCSLHPGSAQVVLNDNEITPKRGQEFLESIIGILQADRWGTDLPIRSFDDPPPKVYTSRYQFNIPYDSQLR